MSWIDDMVQKVKENMTNGVYSPEAESYNATVQDWQPSENTGNEDTNNDENNDITTNPEGYGNTVENWQATEDLPNPVDEIVNTVKDRLTNGVEQPDEGYSESFAQEKIPQQDDLLTFADNYMKTKGDQEGFHQTAMDTGLTEKHKDLATFADEYMKRKNAPKDLEALSKGVMGAVDYLKEPAAAALNAISYLDKPRGALAELTGYETGKLQDANALEALKKGWNTNTSWENLIDENYRKEHPYISKGLGLATDILADPMWLLPPAKIAELVAKGSKVAGVTDKLAPTAEKIAQSELGQKVVATVDDVLGNNRVADTVDEFKAGRATDQVNTDSEILQDIKKAEKDYGKNSTNPLTDYVEAMPREENPAIKSDGSLEYLSALENQKKDMVDDMVKFFNDNPGGKGVTQGGIIRDEAGNVVDRFGRTSNNPEWYQDFWKEYGHAPTKESLREYAEKYLSDHPESGYDDLVHEINDTRKHTDTLGNNEVINSILDDVKTGKAPEMISQGKYSKEDAFNVLRNKGEEIPDYLLQTHQLQAKEAGQAIPDYIYRDQVLSQIPDEGLRKTIQSIGDKVIQQNKAFSEQLLNNGRLSTDQYVHFMEGSHLRRSLEKYDNPEKFLEDVKKYGTQEEWRKAYQDLANYHTNNGFTQSHKVDTKGFIGRQNLSAETLQKLGEVRNPYYKVADTFNRNSKAIREDEFLQKISDMWGKSGDVAADLSKTLPESRKYVQVPEGKTYGALAGQWIPKDVSKQVLNVTGTNKQPGKLGETWQKMVSWWKVEKLAQPASIMRNFYSGMPMANVFGKVPLQAMPKYMAKAGYIFKQGYKSDAYKEAKSTGIFDNVWSKQELQNILGNHPTGVKWLADKSMNLFGSPDQYWRMVTYLYHKDHGKSTKEAAKLANNALFDYSSAPEWVNYLSKNGFMPFARFPFFAAKETAKAAWNNPASLSKWQKPMNNNDEDSENMQKLMPDFMKGKSLLPLWNGKKTVNGKEIAVKNNLDLSYILPFANDVSFGNPIIDALTLARTGKNSLGMDVIKPGMTDQDKVKAYAKYYFDAFGPALTASYNGGKLYDAYKGNVDAKGRQYDLPSAAAQTILGLKNVPVNVDEMYKQQVTHLKSSLQQTAAERTKVKKDASIPQAQKNEKLREYDNQKKELQLQLYGIGQAYRGIKNKGSQ